MEAPVLVVEDHDDARDVLDRMLRHGGFNVVTARNGAEALKHVEAGLKPCLILLDVMMPEMDGPSFAERLRSLEDRSLADTPIVLLTGGHETESAMKRSRALDLLRKPVSFRQICEIVHRHCREPDPPPRS